MVKRRCLLLLFIAVFGLPSRSAVANPWNGKVVLQAFWWDCWNEDYPNDWYTFLAKLAPRCRQLGIDGIWIPSPCKGNSGTNSMGYDVFDHYDLGDKHQKGTTGTRFGNKDSLLRLIAVAHANGLEVYPEVVLNHVIGGDWDDAAPGDKFKKFRYRSFSGSGSGRWAKDHWNFHPNPDHQCSMGDWCEQKFGPDACYLDALHAGGGNGGYMRNQSRQWLVWFRKQTDADGFRFDAVKHFPAFVVEDLLYNAMGDTIEYFTVGELVGGKEQLDQWVQNTQNRSGTFDFGLRDGLANMVDARGFFDLGGLPNLQQQNRLKTSPFVNNHDTWRGAFWDSNPGSGDHDDRDGDWRQNREELGPTIDPDNPRADVAYAAAFAVDGNPTVYYEDLFVNTGDQRFRANPNSHPVRDYVANLMWCHQKLNFKDGPYKVRYQGSPDLLVIERGARAVIGLNDHGTETLAAWVQTDFGAHVKLHDYSGSTQSDLETDGNGWVHLSVPPMSYAVWGRTGLSGGFAPSPRRTTQEFQLDDDLGDADASSLQYGGKLIPTAWRTAGSIWASKDSWVKVWLYCDGKRDAEVCCFRPDADGNKSKSEGIESATGECSDTQPLLLEFQAQHEGYHQVAARLVATDQSPTRGYVKVEYEAPQESTKY